MEKVIRKRPQPIRCLANALSDVIVDLNRQGVRHHRIPDILDTRGRIREYLIANTMLIGIFDTERVDIRDFSYMLLCVGREKTSPPASLFLKTRQGEGFLEGDLSEHSVEVVNHS